jgi:hypothetical protein
VFFLARTKYKTTMAMTIFREINFIIVAKINLPIVGNSVTWARLG